MYNDFIPCWGILSWQIKTLNIADKTMIRLGTRKGAKISIDLGRYGIHAHIIGKAHIPVIPILVGTIELIKNMR